MLLKKSLVAAGIACALAAAPFTQSAPPVTEPVDASVQNKVEYRYIGVSEYYDNGEFDYADLRGIAAMNKACVDTYGVNAKAATIKEASFNTDSSEVNAWVVPEGPVVLAETAGGSLQPMDAVYGFAVGTVFGNAYEAMQGIYCNGFRSISGSATYAGPYIDGVAGEIGLITCGNALRVACSTLVSIPVSD